MKSDACVTTCSTHTAEHLWVRTVVCTILIHIQILLLSLCKKKWHMWQITSVIVICDHTSCMRHTYMSHISGFMCIILFDWQYLSFRFLICLQHLTEHTQKRKRKGTISEKPEQPWYKVQALFSWRLFDNQESKNLSCLPLQSTNSCFYINTLLTLLFWATWTHSLSHRLSYSRTHKLRFHTQHTTFTDTIII